MVLTLTIFLVVLSMTTQAERMVVRMKEPQANGNFLRAKVQSKAMAQPNVAYVDFTPMYPTLKVQDGAEIDFTSFEDCIIRNPGLIKEEYVVSMDEERPFAIQILEKNGDYGKCKHVPIQSIMKEISVFKKVRPRALQLQDWNQGTYEIGLNYDKHTKRALEEWPLIEVENNSMTCSNCYFDAQLDYDIHFSSYFFGEPELYIMLAGQGEVSVELTTKINLSYENEKTFIRVPVPNLSLKIPLILDIGMYAELYGRIAANLDAISTIGGKYKIALHGTRFNLISKEEKPSTDSILRSDFEWTNNDFHIKKFNADFVLGAKLEAIAQLFTLPQFNATLKFETDLGFRIDEKVSNSTLACDLDLVLKGSIADKEIQLAKINVGEKKFEIL